MNSTNSSTPTLSFGSQKKSLVNKLKRKKNVKGNRKQVLKNSLASPFTLDWPSLDFKKYSEIVTLLKEALIGLNVNNHRPPYSLYCNMKKKERIEYIKEYRRSHENSLARPQSKSHFVVGFNAVMRGLEKNQIICIFVNIDAKPDFLVRLFIPQCSLKNVPLIPIKGLEDLAKNPNALGVNKCLAFGLTEAVLDSNSCFNKLYKKSCLTLGLQCTKSSFHKAEMNNLNKDKTATAITTTPSKSQNEKDVLSSDEIRSLHLKRENKLARAFRPSVESSELNYPIEAPIRSVSPRWEESPASPAVEVNASQLPSDTMFLIESESDDDGKKDISDEEGKNKNSDGEGKNEHCAVGGNNENSDEGKHENSDDIGKMKNSDEDKFDQSGSEGKIIFDKRKIDMPYSVETEPLKRKATDFISAKIKRIKSNPSRKRNHLK